LRRRRAVGLSFAGAHAVHLVALVSAIVLFGDEASLVSIVGGGLGYVFVAAMALTSNDAAVRAMGPPNWRLLHTVGSYLIAGIFAFSYFGRLEDKPVLAVTALSLLAMTAALKAAAWIKFRMPRRATR
jgi:DMSO/TMAO reductase YedYZ heme-binding membrane subunit